MTDTELHAQAIEAAVLAFYDCNGGDHISMKVAIAVYLSIAPQAPVSAAPVAYRFADGGGYNADWRYSTYDPREYPDIVEDSGASCLSSCTPLYMAPPPPAQADDDKDALILELLAALDRIAKGEPYHWCNSRAEVALAKAKQQGYEP
jgi:hypothetical protein